MSKMLPAGIVTAYGAAVRGGYTGTYEQFCQDQAGFAEAAQQVREDKESVEQTVQTFEETTFPEVVQSVKAEGTRQIGLVGNAGTSQIGSVNAAGSAAVGTVNQAGTTQVNAVNSAGTTQVGNVNSAGSAQVQAVEDKGEEVIESIPADYTELSNNVDELDDAFYKSPNLYDPSKNSIGLIAVVNGDLYPSYTDWVSSDYIPVNPGDTIRAQFTMNGIRHDSGETNSEWAFNVICYYDATKGFISGESQASIVTTPTDTKFIRFSKTLSSLENKTDITVLDTTNSDILPYSPYGAIVELKESKIPVSYDMHIKQIADAEIEDVVDPVIEPIEDIIDAFVRSPNLYDTSENVVGVLLASNGNLYPTYTDFVTSGYIPVTPDGTIRAQYYYGGMRHDVGESGSVFQYYTSCFYDANKTFISGSGGNNTKLLTVPHEAAYFRFSLTNSAYATLRNIAIIESDSGEVLPYVEPDSIWYLEEQYIPESYDEHIKEVVGLNADGIILNVPSKIYAVTGLELNVYFENITDDWNKYQWNVTCAKGKQMARGYSITPSASDVGEYPITIRASIDANTYKEVSATLVVTALSTGTGLSVIVLGDSTTDNGQAVTKIHTDFEAASTTVQTLGTRGTAPNNHEGRSGWRAYYYVSSQSQGGVDNPFYNPSTSTFDASYYFANSGVSVPDWFFINLGINDVFGYDTDLKLIGWMPTIIGYYDTMVASLKSAAPNMKIGVCITIPPNDSQDAFGKDYNCGQTRDRCKRNNAIWAEYLIEHFSDQEDENVYLVPIHVNLDTVYNMGLGTVPVNARNTSVTYQSPTANGGVHPAESGYWQIADVYTAFLKAYAN